MEAPINIVEFVECILDTKLDDWHKKYLEQMYELYEAGKLTDENIITATRGRSKVDRDAIYLLFINGYENLAKEE